MRHLMQLMLVIGSGAAGAGTQVDGFPIYPPDTPSPEHPERFTVEFPDRKAMLKASEQSAQDNEARIRAALQWIREGKRFLDTEPAARGWVIVGAEYYTDGGSRTVRYARIADGKLHVMASSFWAGLFAFNEDGSFRSPRNRWAEVDYGLQVARAPREIDGFPLPFAPRGTDARVEATRQGRTVEYAFEGERACASCSQPYPIVPPLSVPGLRGWSRRSSPLLSPEEGLFTKDGRDVLLTIGRGGAKVTWFTPKAAQRFIAAHPETVTRSAVVDGGCIILDGRFLPRPYQLELADHVLRVDGVVRAVFAPGPQSAEELYAFNSLRKQLEDGLLEVKDHGGSGISANRAEAQIQAFLHRVDAIVRGTGSREEKRHLLETDPATREFLVSDSESGAVLDRWDGLHPESRGVIPDAAAP